MGWQGRLPESATSLSGIDLFVFSESVACLITVLHLVYVMDSWVRAVDKREYLVINQDNFCKFCIKKHML